MSGEKCMLALIQTKTAGRGGQKPMAAATGRGMVPANSAMRGRIRGNQIYMQLLATLLSRFERETVVDFTGMQGLYEFALEWMPDDSVATPECRTGLHSRPRCANNWV